MINRYNQAFVYLDKAKDPKDINDPQSCMITGEK